MGLADAWQTPRLANRPEHHPAVEAKSHVAVLLEGSLRQLHPYDCTRFSSLPRGKQSAKSIRNPVRTTGRNTPARYYTGRRRRTPWSPPLSPSFEGRSGERERAAAAQRREIIRPGVGCGEALTHPTACALISPAKLHIWHGPRRNPACRPASHPHATCHDDGTSPFACGGKREREKGGRKGMDAGRDGNRGNGRTQHQAQALRVPQSQYGGAP
jgi:hypothetical protein